MDYMDYKILWLKTIDYFRTARQPVEWTAEEIIELMEERELAMVRKLSVEKV